MDNTLNKQIDNLTKEFSELFKTYDFFISDKIPENAKKAIDIGANKYIIFIDRKIKETLNDKLKDFVEEQNKAFKEGKGWIDLETTENGCN